MLDKFSIVKKIWLIVGISCFAFLGVLASSTYFTLKINSGTTLLSERLYDVSKLASRANVEFKSVDEFYTQAVTLSDEELLSSAKQRSDNVKGIIDNIIEIEPAHEHLKQLIYRLEAYTRLSSKIAKAFVDGSVDFSTIKIEIDEKTKLFNALSQEFIEFENLADDIYKSELTQISTNVENSLQFTLLVGLCLVSLMIMIGVMVGKSIFKVANQLILSLHELATGTGSLSCRLSVTSNDELGHIAREFNAFMILLQNSFSDITQLIEPMRTNAENLESSMSTMNEITVHQSEEVDLVSQSMMEMKASVKDISESAHSASNSANQAKVVAQNGLDKVKTSVSYSTKLVHEMNNAGNAITELSEQTSKVTDILKSINDIADQTNLLALNAAIEAARAGAHGKGFAVVAEEVRHLSSKTANSVSTIRTVLERLVENINIAVSIIGETIQFANEGATFAGDAGEAIERINHEIEAINSVNAQIASATEEQSSVATHIVENTKKMKQSFSQAQLLLNKVNNVSTELNSLSEKLIFVSSKFKE